MQRDTALTFKETHGSWDALCAAVEEIEHVALVESADIGPYRDRLQCLRLLEPYPQGGSDYDFVLTPARTHRRSEDYIAVSYTWAHSQPAHDTPIPDYRIWDLSDPRSVPRPLRCPAIVFHRVIQFSRARQCLRIWIDQECINQTDPIDVEQHLQVMHRIYRLSRWTVAVLSCEITTQIPMQRVLQSVKIADFKSVTNGAFKLFGSDTQLEMFQLLQFVTRDRWFTRTWTFHEKYCAASVDFLLPICPETVSGLRLSFPYAFVGNDVDISIDEIRNFLEHMNSDPWLDLKAHFENRGQSALLAPNVPKVIKTVHDKMENCDNLVTSDRLAVLANVCGLEWKLETTALESPRYSYSTCLLVLVMVNAWPRNAVRARKYREMQEYIMSNDVKTFIQGRVLSESVREDIRMKFPGWNGVI